MPGPNSHPRQGKTVVDIQKGKQGRSYTNRKGCAIREGGGKFKGQCNCPKHKSLK